MKLSLNSSDEIPLEVLNKIAHKLNKIFKMLKTKDYLLTALEDLLVHQMHSHVLY